ncbi:MAG TPA: prepilin-type N-terminal cleavage/methylation domain-containing protein [Verrucomicrobiota bacterium]|nr:prepilin-type N-terminal cleavage/methylation domain-containing protein [Verrucomicrobiota bacterium]HNT13467.1 prepilin-type N-terminal cleavage/methylation domain-containing protein [Verrucomicrobiota bacterium]
MKILSSSRTVCLRRGFTLAELMISMSIFSMVTIGLIAIHLFGQRYDQLVLSKLGASDQSRVGLNKMLQDIRTAKTVRVGTLSGSTFTPIANGTAQQGTALKLSFFNYSSAAISNSIYYYFDTANNQLWRQVDAGTPTLLASHLTNITPNSMTFRVEDYRGDTVTDLTHKGVISTVLEYAQYQYPLTSVGPGLKYDYYKTELKAASHVPDGP